MAYRTLENPSITAALGSLPLRSWEAAVEIGIGLEGILRARTLHFAFKSDYHLPVASRQAETADQTTYQTPGKRLRTRRDREEA